MHTVIIEGDQLDYFRSITSSAIRGDLGTLRAVQLYVQDDGRIVLGTNGYTSEPFGRPNAPLSQPVYSSPEQALEEAVVAEANEVVSLANSPSDEGDTRNFDNPYRNVERDEAQGNSQQELSKRQRIQRLELFAELASRRHGLEDLWSQADSAVRAQEDNELTSDRRDYARP